MTDLKSQVGLGSYRTTLGPTDLEGPASSMLVVVADPLQLAATRELPDHKLQAPPETFAVEEDEELGQNSEEESKGGRYQICLKYQGSFYLSWEIHSGKTICC